MTVRSEVETLYNDVNDWLSVGGDLDLAHYLTDQTYDETIGQLTEHGVTHVIDARIEWCDELTWIENGLPSENHCYAPIVDWWKHSPDEGWFRTVEDFVAKFWANSYEGDRLYVHCHMGINRGPSAAMIALLTIEPAMHPYEAFLMVRDARPAAGLVYADVIGARHIAMSDRALGEIPAYSRLIRDYWAPETIREETGGVAYYRDADGETREWLT